MNWSEETIQKIREVAYAALTKVNSQKVDKDVKRAVRFASAQNPTEIVLDGKTVKAVAVDIATVFSLEGYYHTIIDENGYSRTVEFVEALSIVIVGDDVRLCKSTYDAFRNPVTLEEKFLNCVYRTTAVEDLTEDYIC